MTQAAEGQSRDVVDKVFFNHTGSVGGIGDQRITKTGYIWNAWAENIAARQTSVNSMVAYWMASPGQCAHLMDPDFVDIGAVCVKGAPATSYGRFWTLNLGRKRSPTTTEPANPGHL